MADRQQFLAEIRARLDAPRRAESAAYQPTHAPDSPWTRPRPVNTIPLEATDRPQRFLAELRALGGHGERVASLGAAAEYILALARERRAGSLIRWDDALLDELALDEALRAEGVAVLVWGPREQPRADVARADIGLSGAEYAIAETGSLVLASGLGKSRAVTLLPPTYVAVVPVERVVPSVAELIAHYAGQTGLPASLTLHTGPSRSGDIEQTLSIGVHGPGDIHVLLVG